MRWAKCAVGRCQWQCYTQQGQGLNLSQVPLENEDDVGEGDGDWRVDDEQRVDFVPTGSPRVMGDAKGDEVLNVMCECDETAGTGCFQSEDYSKNGDLKLE